MCLWSITARYRDNTELRKGYKVFRSVQGVLLFENCAYESSFTVPRGKWIHTSARRGEQDYRLGFHVYNDKRCADSSENHSVGYKTTLVYCKNIIVIGRQRCIARKPDAFVCTSIYVPKDKWDIPKEFRSKR